MYENLYPLNPGDKEIFRLALKDANYFTNYYLRSATSGTWWLPGAVSDRWKTGYDRLHEHWKILGCPESFELGGNAYTVALEHERSYDFPTHPAFHHNHGMLFLPWAHKLHHDRTPFRTIIGGFGSGKTVALVKSLLVYAAILPGFRAFALAPYSVQSMEVYKIALDLLDGTVYKERFLLGAPKKPFPQLIIGNEHVGVNSIECYPILNNSEKLRTLTGDCAIIDQSEKLEDIQGVIRDIGTRFRGRVPRTGRERLGTLTFLANSGDNQQLWDLYDEGEYEPKNYVSISPSSYDNIYLTDRDIQRFEMQVGESQEAKDQYLLGKRPLGNGEHFSRAVLEMMRDPDLDRVMEQGLNNGWDGYSVQEVKNVGVYEWLLPPMEGRKYLVISDPGTKNPPHRDSPPIMIWDITDFPGKRDDPKPLRLVGFVWVFGNNSIANWADRYAELVYRYKAIGSNGFDATGFQSGYDQWMMILSALFPEKINLAGNGKFLCLNSAKVLTANGMVKVPTAVSVIFQQLARYEYPETKRLRQDVVMAFIMSCWWAMRLYYFDDSEYEEREDYDPNDRYSRALESRYTGR